MKVTATFFRGPLEMSGAHRLARRRLSSVATSSSHEHHRGSDTTLPPVKRLLKKLYLSGTSEKGTPRLGQPRVVAAITGGGGLFFADLLREPGASSCFLEGVIPYDKNSCLSFISRHRRLAQLEGIGFCSADMAALLAESARDRALQLTPLLSQWPDAVGVSCTATIISHYTRRGDYRAHAAACAADGTTSTLSHHIVKGARDRAGEDAACALLAMRALAGAVDSAAESANELAPYGIRVQAAAEPALEPVNPVGERASGVEAVPERVHRSFAGPDAHHVAAGAATGAAGGRGGALRVVLPDPRPDAARADFVTLPAPAVLPENALIVIMSARERREAMGQDGVAAAAEAACVALAQDALVALGRQGDGQKGSWGVPQV